MPGSLSFKLLMALLGAIVVSALSVKLTYDYCEGQQAREQVREFEQRMALAEQLRQAFGVVARASAEREAKQAVKDRIIVKESIRYVQVTPPESRCTLPGTWRVRHDAAATGQPPADQDGADAAGEPVEDAAALETITDNYESCRADKRRLEDFQAYWRLIDKGQSNGD